MRRWPRTRDSRPRRRAANHWGAAARRRGSAALLAAVIATGLGFGDPERGNRLYREGRVAEAVEAYREALEDGRSTPELHYNLGTALLTLGSYEEAESHFARALATLDPTVLQHTHYNLGNRFLEAGRRDVGEPEERRKLLSSAVTAYQHALRLDPSDQDAKWNLELALQERDQLPQPAPGGMEQEEDSESEQGEGEPEQLGDAGAGSPGAGAGSPSPGERPDGQAAPGELSREQAERILGAVEQDERELYREKLRQGRRERPVLRDW